MCHHEVTRDLRERCYTEPVSRDENPAAHGWMTVTVECATCGARREENRNGGHLESGPWGDDRRTREHRAAKARRVAVILAARRPAGCSVVRGKYRVTVTIDDDGCLLMVGDGPHPTLADLARLWPDGVNYARNLRMAVLAAEREE